MANLEIIRLPEWEKDPTLPLPDTGKDLTDILPKAGLTYRRIFLIDGSCEVNILYKLPDGSQQLLNCHKYNPDGSIIPDNPAVSDNSNIPDAWKRFTNIIEEGKMIYPSQEDLREKLANEETVPYYKYPPKETAETIIPPGPNERYNQERIPSQAEELKEKLTSIGESLRRIVLGPGTNPSILETWIASKQPTNIPIDLIIKYVATVLAVAAAVGGFIGWGVYKIQIWFLSR